MISVLTMAFQQYLKCEFQRFTEKLILAKGIFELLDEYDKKDLKSLDFIETNTNDKVMISIYKLDRVINPTKGEFKTIQSRFTFTKNKSKEEITLTENEIQQALCVAIREVHQIVMRTMKDYKIEQSMTGIGDGETSKELAGLFKV